MEEENQQRRSTSPSIEDNEGGGESDGNTSDATTGDCTLHGSGSSSPNESSEHGSDGEEEESEDSDDAARSSRRSLARLTPNDLLLQAVAQAAGLLARNQGIKSGQLTATLEERANLNNAASAYSINSAPYYVASNILTLAQNKSPQSSSSDSSSDSSEDREFIKEATVKELAAYGQLSTGLEGLKNDLLMSGKVSGEVAPLLMMVLAREEPLAPSANLAMAAAYAAAAYADPTMPLTIGGLVWGRSACGAASLANSPEDVHLPDGQVASLTTVTQWLTEALKVKMEKVRRSLNPSPAQQQLTFSLRVGSMGKVESGVAGRPQERPLQDPPSSSSSESDEPMVPKKRGRPLKRPLSTSSDSD